MGSKDSKLQLLQLQTPHKSHPVAMKGLLDGEESQDVPGLMMSHPT